MLHEFAHLLLGDSVLHRASLETLDNTSHRIEAFCNAVAAAVLVPRPDLEREIAERGHGPDATWPEADVIRLANRYMVSRAMFVRRLRIVGAIRRSQFLTLRDRFDKYRPKTGEGGNPYANRLSHLGTLLPSLAFQSYYGDRATATDLSALFSLKVKNLERMEQQLLEKQKART